MLNTANGAYFTNFYEKGKRIINKGLRNTIILLQNLGIFV